MQDYCLIFFEKEAENYLQLFREKNNMNNSVVINVEINGKKVPLHQISEQTLLTIRENSKPKPVPAFQVCDAYGTKRLVLKLPDNMQHYTGQYVSFDKNGKWQVVGKDMKTLLSQVTYTNLRELKLEEL